MACAFTIIGKSCAAKASSQPLPITTCLAVAAAANRFSSGQQWRARFDLNYHYAYHFDATLYAHYLRKWSEQRGVERLEGKVVDVQPGFRQWRHSRDKLEDGTELMAADLFIDCTGFPAF